MKNLIIILTTFLLIVSSSKPPIKVATQSTLSKKPEPIEPGAYTTLKNPENEKKLMSGCTCKNETEKEFGREDKVLTEARITKLMR